MDIFLVGSQNGNLTSAQICPLLSSSIPHSHGFTVWHGCCSSPDGTDQVAERAAVLTATQQSSQGNPGSRKTHGVQDRATAREKGDKDEKVGLRKEVRKQAKRDKTQWLKDRLAEEQPLDARQLKWIKQIRTDHNPRPLSILGKDGEPTSRFSLLTANGLHRPRPTQETAARSWTTPTSAHLVSAWRSFGRPSEK